MLDQESERIFPVTHTDATGSNQGLIWICAFILRSTESPPIGGLSQYAYVCECRWMQIEERPAHTHTRALAAHPEGSGSPNIKARFAVEGCTEFLFAREENSLLSTETINLIFILLHQVIFSDPFKFKMNPLCNRQKLPAVDPACLWGSGNHPISPQQLLSILIHACRLHNLYMCIEIW